MVTKKQSAQKVYLKKIKFEDQKHRLEANQHEIKINQLEKINLMHTVFDKVMKNP